MSIHVAVIVGCDDCGRSTSGEMNAGTLEVTAQHWRVEPKAARVLCPECRVTYDLADAKAMAAAAQEARLAQARAKGPQVSAGLGALAAGITGS